MKKILAGCLIVIVIALIGFGVAGYYAYRAMKPMIDNAAGYMDKAREVARLGEGITNRRPFEPPKNGELTSSQVERFIAVQTRVRAELDDRWQEIEKKSSEIRARAERGSSDWTLSEFTAVFSDIASIYLDGRRAQVNALNVQKFSEAEYEWVRKRVYEAAGVELAGNIDFSQVESLARDQSVGLPEIDVPKIPEANIRLVKPHTAKIKQWIPMAVLGL